MAEVVIGGIILEKILGGIFGGNGNAAANEALAKANKNLQNQIDANQQQIKKLLDQVEKSKITSLKDLSENEKKIFDQVVELCKAEPAYELAGKNVGFFGIVSVGKSSLINALIGKKVAATEIGETTTEYQAYPGIFGLTYWDCPGKHDNLNYLTASYISLIKGLSTRIIVVDITLKHITGLIKLLQRLSLPFILVINKYDDVEREDAEDRTKFEATITKEINEYCPLVRVFRVSSKQPGKFDWDEFVQTITS